MKISFVENIRDAWKFLTVNLSLGLIIFGSMDAKTQADILQGLFDLLNIGPERLPMVLGVTYLVIRLVAFNKPPEE